MTELVANTSSASRGVRCETSIAPWRAASGVQYPSTMPTLLLKRGHRPLTAPGSIQRARHRHRTVCSAVSLGTSDRPGDTSRRR